MYVAYAAISRHCLVALHDKKFAFNGHMMQAKRLLP